MSLSHLCVDDRRSNLTAESSFGSRVDFWFLGIEKSEKRNMQAYWPARLPFELQSDNSGDKVAANKPSRSKRKRFGDDSS